jgi:hypothetical protein
MAFVGDPDNGGGAVGPHRDGGIVNGRSRQRPSAAEVSRGLTEPGAQSASGTSCLNPSDDRPAAGVEGDRGLLE